MRAFISTCNSRLEIQASSSPSSVEIVSPLFHQYPRRLLSISCDFVVCTLCSGYSVVCTLYSYLDRDDAFYLILVLSFGHSLAILFFRVVISECPGFLNYLDIGQVKTHRQMSHQLGALSSAIDAPPALPFTLLDCQIYNYFYLEYVLLMTTSVRHDPEDESGHK